MQNWLSLQLSSKIFLDLLKEEFVCLLALCEPQLNIVDILGFVCGTDQQNLLMFLDTKAELQLADLWAVLTMRATFFPCAFLIVLYP